MLSFIFKGHADQAPGRAKLLANFLIVSIILTFSTGISAAELIVNGSFEEPDTTTLASTRATLFGWTTFYGQNKSDADPCSSHVDPNNPFNPDDPSTFIFFDPVTNWEVECNGDMKLPGWEVYWTDTLLMEGPGGELVINPAPDEPGRLEIQHNSLPMRRNPALIAMGKRPIAFARFGAQKAELDSHDRLNLATGKPDDDSNVTLMQSVQTCENRAYTLKYSWRSRTEMFGDNDVRVAVGDNVVRTHDTTSDWVEETINFFSDDTGETLIGFFSIGTGTRKGMSLDGVSLTGPKPDENGYCPPPPCETDNSCTTDGYADANGDGVHDDLDHHVDGVPIGCACDDDDSSDDGSSDDGSSDDGSSDDGSSDDGSSDDGSSDDGSSDDGSSDDGSSDDGSSDDGSSDDDSSDDNSCGLCDDKPDYLTLVYDGDDFTSHDQDDSKVSIFPEVVAGGLPVDAYIEAFDKHGNPLGSAGLRSKGDTFDIPMQGSQVTLEIMDANGDILQTVTFHISCSQPLDVGDSFGGISIWGGHD